MRTFELHRECLVPRPLDEVFAFFASPANLPAVTPPRLGLRIVSPPPAAITVGTRLDYRLRVRGVPLRWQSEITAWQPPHRFVDEQRRGPYRLWIHEHLFAAQADGTRVTDRVCYALWGGALVQRLVAGDLERIFDFRERRQRELLAPDGDAARAQGPRRDSP
jgi:ligand-binding SRPBCC domain-containing protein